jgi:hypothetical protein
MLKAEFVVDLYFSRLDSREKRLQQSCKFTHSMWSQVLDEIIQKASYVS